MGEVIEKKQIENAAPEGSRSGSNDAGTSPATDITGGRKRSRVAAVRCNSYKRETVEAAVKEAVRLLGGIGGILDLPKDAEIILKPNMLMKAAPEKAVTTHPEVFRAVGKVLREAGYTNLRYGDSPGAPVSMEKVAEGCGISQVAGELDIMPGDFEHGREVKFSEGRTASHFVLCEEVAKVCLGDSGESLSEGQDDQQTDGECQPATGNRGAIIDICKMKTHQLERITGAVKNTFGCVYGVNKSMSHARFPNAEVFARMTADLNRLVKPALHIMDGVVAMEGNGPASGDPVKMNIILASTDPVALDTIFCNLIDLNQDLVPTCTACSQAGIGTKDEDEIDVIISGMPMEMDGTVMDADSLAAIAGNRDFVVQRNISYRGRFRYIGWILRLFEKKPYVIEERCVGCGICEKTCPIDGKAIHVADGKARYQYSKCIRCYCCQEMCPEKAINVKKSILSRFIDREWKF